VLGAAAAAAAAAAATATAAAAAAAAAATAAAVLGAAAVLICSVFDFYHRQDLLAELAQPTCATAAPILHHLRVHTHHRARMLLAGSRGRLPPLAGADAIASASAASALATPAGGCAIGIAIGITFITATK
jgi:hypothetical protein